MHGALKLTSVGDDTVIIYIVDFFDRSALHMLTLKQDTKN